MSRTAALRSGVDVAAVPVVLPAREDDGDAWREAAETMDGVAGGVGAPVAGYPSPETRQRMELPVEHRSLNLLRTKTFCHIKQMRTSRRKRGGGTRDARSVEAHRKRQRAAAATEDSGEPVRRPGGVFSRGKRGERRGRGWGIYRQNGRNQFALNSPEFGKDLPTGFWAVICSGGRRR